jgi:hypothetical protein
MNFIEVIWQKRKNEEVLQISLFWIPIKWIYLGKEREKPDLIEIKLKKNYFPIRKSPYFSRT